MCKQKLKTEYARRNREKVNEAKRSYRLKNLDRDRANKRAWFAANKDKHHGYTLKKYGLSREDYTQRLSTQGGACACCGALRNEDGRRFYVDHCHVTGRVRGLLCYRCNTGIGSLGDNAEGVRRALDYLEKTDKPLLMLAF